MMFAMIAPNTILFLAIAAMVATAVACFLAFTVAVTLLGVKLIVKALSSSTSMTDNNDKLFRNHQFGTVDGRSSEVCGDVDFFTVNGHIVEGSFGGTDFHAAIHNGFLDQGVDGFFDAGWQTAIDGGMVNRVAPFTESFSSVNVPAKVSSQSAVVDKEQNLTASITTSEPSNGSSRVTVPPPSKVGTTIAPRSVHFELKNNRVHEIIHITEYSQEERGSCWYTREEVGEIRANAFIADLVGPCYDNHDFLESGVPAVIFFPSVFAPSPTGTFIGPTFMGYREPPKNIDFDEDVESTTASTSTDDDEEAQPSAPIDDDMEDLLNAFSKLSSEDTTSSKTASGDFESSTMAELVDAFAKL